MIDQTWQCKIPPFYHLFIIICRCVDDVPSKRRPFRRDESSCGTTAEPLQQLPLLIRHAVRGWPRSLAAKNGHGTVVLDVHSWNGTHLECCPMFSDVSHTRSYHAIFLMASGAFSGKMSAESLCDLIPPGPVVWGRPSNYGFGEVAHLGECHYNYLISDNGPRRSHCQVAPSH